MNIFFKNFFIFLLLTFLVWPSFAFAINYDSFITKTQTQVPPSQKAIYDALSKLNLGNSFFKTNLAFDNSQLKKINENILNFIEQNIPSSIDYGVSRDFSFTAVHLNNMAGNLPVEYKLAGIECVFCTEVPGGDMTQKPENTNYSSGIVENVNNLSLIRMDFKFDVAEYLKAQNGQFPKSVDFKLNVLWQTADGSSYIMLHILVPIALNSVDCTKKATPQLCSQNATICMWASKIGSGECISKTDEKVCNSLTNTECAQSTVCTLDKNSRCALKQRVDGDKEADARIAAEHPVPFGYAGPLPECAFTGTCRDVNDLVKIGLNSVKYIFSIVAGLAFVMFIYGGFTWIFSFGNSEKVKKGQQIFTYAVIGLVIVFSAYILVGFLLDALNVSETFRGI